MSLWSWSSEIWTDPAVRAACLTLQDDHAQCIPLLLWRAWALETGVPVDAFQLERAVGLSRAWTDAVAAPLRPVRRGVSEPFAGIDDGARTAVREALLKAELSVERALLEGLERLGGGSLETNTGVHEWGGVAVAILELATLWGNSPGSAAFAPLTTAFEARAHVG